MIEEEGVSFEEAVDILFDEYDAPNYTWASYGAYDRNKFKNQCKDSLTDYPFSDYHINVKEQFKRSADLRKSIGMERALKHLKIKMSGRHHRGVDDAYNTAKILQWCLKNE